MIQNRIRELEEEGSNDAEKVMLCPFHFVFVFAEWSYGPWGRIEAGAQKSVEYRRLVTNRVLL